MVVNQELQILCFKPTAHILKMQKQRNKNGN